MFPLYQAGSVSYCQWLSVCSMLLWLSLLTPPACLSPIAPLPFFLPFLFSFSLLLFRLRVFLAKCLHYELFVLSALFLFVCCHTYFLYYLFFSIIWFLLAVFLFICCCSVYSILYLSIPLSAPHLFVCCYLHFFLFQHCFLLIYVGFHLVALACSILMFVSNIYLWFICS